MIYIIQNINLEDLKTGGLLDTELVYLCTILLFSFKLTNDNRL